MIMKKILLIIGMMLLLFSCNRGYRSNRSYSEDSIEVDSVDTDTSGSISLYHTPEEINRFRDSMNAIGAGYVLERGADRNYDTIINHIHFIYTTEK